MLTLHPSVPATEIFPAQPLLFKNLKSFKPILIPWPEKGTSCPRHYLVLLITHGDLQWLCIGTVSLLHFGDSWILLTIKVEPCNWFWAYLLYLLCISFSPSSFPPAVQLAFVLGHCQLVLRGKKPHICCIGIYYVSCCFTRDTMTITGLACSGKRNVIPCLWHIFRAWRKALLFSYCFLHNLAIFAYWVVCFLTTPDWSGSFFLHFQCFSNP